MKFKEIKVTYFINNRSKSLARLFIFIFSYIKIFFIRKYFFDFNGFYQLIKYSGHPVVVECLDKGSKEIGLDYFFYKYNMIYNEIAIVNSGIENLELCIKEKKNGKIKTIVAGPNLVVLPNEHNSILSNNFIDIVLTPSKWVSNNYVKIEPNLQNKVYEWYSGIDHIYWNDNKKQRNLITFYLKYSAGPIPENIMDYINFVKSLGYKTKIIEYNKYNRKEYKEALNKSILLIFFSNHESQGLASGESWSCNTPTLVWNNKQTIIGKYKIESLCCPYLNNECGDFFSGFEDFKDIFINSINNYNKYNPRKWILENMTYKISIENLINLIKSKKNN